MNITLQENGLFLDILVTEEGDVRLLHLSNRELPAPDDSSHFRLVEIQESGQNQDGRRLQACRHAAREPAPV